VETVLIAVGGNALYDKSSGNNLDSAQVQAVCERIAQAVQQGYLPVVTFGNGPQVGNLLDMAETSARMFKAPITLDTCVAWTQGEIGYRLQQALHNALTRLGIHRPIIAVNTTVSVNPQDPAIQKPSKPVGRFISPEEAQQLYEERGWVVGPDANRGFRRMVPSPMPLAIQEADAIRSLIQQGYIVLCCGGGGIPIQPLNAQDDASYTGFEAVIDKDFTSCLLAKSIGIDHVIICTEVENVYLNFGQPNQTALHQVPLDDADRYMAEGHFSAGSMGPKVAAMIDYLKHGGKRAIITSLEKTIEALNGNAGTQFVQSVVGARP
jgi:carbamate kinase